MLVSYSFFQAFIVVPYLHRNPNRSSIREFQLSFFRSSSSGLHPSSISVSKVQPLEQSFPKKINKAKINEIFEILQSHKRPDLVKEIKNLVLLNTRAIDGPNMTEMDTSTNKVLPTEMLKAILEKLNYKSLSSSRQICKRWKEIIDGFKLVEKAFGKHLWKCSSMD